MLSSAHCTSPCADADSIRRDVFVYVNVVTSCRVTSGTRARTIKVKNSWRVTDEVI